MGQIGRLDTDTQALIKRIAAHDLYGQFDLNEWCFQQMQLQRGMAVLDLGCGTGKQSLAMAERGNTVTSVDASAASLEVLAATAAERGLNSITTITSGLDDLAQHVQGKAFDRCVSAYAIYYAKDPEQLFRVIHSALKPDGSLFFCGPAYDNNMEVKEFLKAIGHSFTPGAAPFMEEQGQQIARSIFSKVETSKFENPLTFSSAEALWVYWSSHNMYDPSLEDRFKKRAAEHFSEHDSFQMVKRVRGVLATK